MTERHIYLNRFARGAVCVGAAIFLAACTPGAEKSSSIRDKEKIFDVSNITESLLDRFQRSIAEVENLYPDCVIADVSKHTAGLAEGKDDYFPIIPVNEENMEFVESFRS